MTNGQLIELLSEFDYEAPVMIDVGGDLTGLPTPVMYAEWNESDGTVNLSDW